MRTLVIHLGGIGDFLLTLPSLVRLSQRGPLELLGHKDRLEMAVDAGWAEAAHRLDAVGFTSAFGNPDSRLRGFLGRFDRCIAWIRDDDGRLAKNLRACGIGRVEAYPGLPPEDWCEPASLYYARCLGYEDAPTIRMNLEPSCQGFDVLIHPGSGSTRKNWPLKHYEALATWLMGEGRRVTWCRGPAEEEMAFPTVGEVVEFGSLVSLGRALASTKLYVGNDNGVTHLAACVGCPTVAVFGPTDPVVWAPRGDHVSIVSRKPWPLREDVRNVLAAHLESQYCHGG